MTIGAHESHGYLHPVGGSPGGIGGCLLGGRARPGGDGRDERSRDGWRYRPSTEPLPAFWQVFGRPEHGESKFALKALVTDKTGEEYFWATDIARRDGKILGTIDNDPKIVGSVKFGDRIEISEGDISDWMYMRNGKMVGNHTVRPLFKRMPAPEVERIRKMLADP